MNTTRSVLLLWVLGAVLTPAARAAALPGHFGTNSMIVAAGAPRLSLGANIEILQRNIVLEGQNEGQLEANTYSAYVGYDATAWLTLFGTAGGVFVESLDTPVTGEDYDVGLRWSLGFNASLFHINTVNRDFAPGRFSIGLIGEFASSDGSGDSGNVSWTDMSVALPIGYEIPNEPMYFWGVTSLFVYAGPVLSSIDGTAEAGADYDFSEEQEIGALCGLEIYHTRQISLGANVQIMDEASANLSARYHF